MKKRILALLLVCCMVLSMIPAVSAVEQKTSSGLGVVTSGTCGDNLTWNWSYEDGEGYLVISGTGPMYDYSDESDSTHAPWYQYVLYNTPQDDNYRSLRATVVIEPGVTSIGAYAFADCYVDEITISDTVVQIGDYAFKGVRLLRDIVIPETVTFLGNGVFQSALELNSVDILADIPELPDRTCYGAFELQSVTLPQRITAIGDEAFFSCYNLTLLAIPEMVQCIGAGVFYDCRNIENFVIPASVSTIGEEAFALCGVVVADPDNAWFVTDDDGVLFSKDKTNLIHVPADISGIFSVPDSVGTISPGAFFHCHGLTGIRFGQNVRQIGARAFVQCSSLTSVSIPEGIHKVEDNTFAMCYALEQIRLPSTLECIGKYALSSTGILTITIPESVTSIEENAFHSCRSLESVYFRGHAPQIAVNEEYLNEHGSVISSGAFTDVLEVTCYYPKEDSSWNEAIRLDYGGNLNWVSYDPNETPTEPTEPEPTDPEPTDPEPNEPIENPFNDVKVKDYFYKAVLWAVEKGVTTGISATSFGPNNSCTRAQVVTFLWRAAGEPEPTSTKNPFKDVKQSDYFYKAVLWAVENGITTGTGATTFSPNAPCTRGQVVTFLYRSAGTPEPESSKNPFSDVKTKDFYYDAVLWAVGEGITTGTSATKFGPGNTCTRAQVVTFLYRVFND